MKYGLLIDNTDVPASGGTFHRHNPVDGSVVTTAGAGRAVDVELAVCAAAAAFPSWSQTGPSQRRKILNKAADILDEWTPRFIELGIAETGGNAPWHGFNMYFAAKILREAASMTTQVKGEIIPSDKPDSLAMGYRQPVGVLVGIAPWNAAQILGVRSFAMPIACGNTMVMKASEKCPGTHRLLGDAMREAGLPDGVLNIITNEAKDGPEVVNALIDHPLTRRINFTGSSRVGRIIAERAARHLKPCLLELGGKSPLIVLDDADIDAAVNAAKFGAFMNQGQICMSTERLIVDQKVADRFVAALVAKTEQLRTGTPIDQFEIAACVDRDTVEHVGNLIGDAKAKGATIVCGGNVPTTGAIMSPTIVDNVTREMRIYDEESFGPITAVLRVRDTEHAIEVANDSEYGLTASVFGKDLGRALKVAKRIESGICHINGPTVFDEPQMPFGGLKRSGYGRFGGEAGIAEFTELRWISIEDPEQPYPI